MFAICVVLGACDNGSSGGTPSLTKDEARARGGKADDGADFCALFDWYGDGVCDDWCPAPDPDCEPECPTLPRWCLTLTCPAGGLAVDEDGCTLCECDDGGPADGGVDCRVVDCAAPPPGCSYVDDGSCCGRLECEGGSTCGGLRGAGCPDTEYCDYPDGAMCGAADETGTCRTRPDACAEIYSPVCGCDGHTYSNACDAASVGVDTAHDGDCSTAADCRSTGCSAGQWCSFCWGTFSCIPDGAKC